MITRSGELHFAQADGNLPTTLAAGSAPGESGVSVLGVRFQGAMHFSATLRQHVVCFGMQARFACRVGSRVLRHEPPLGSLAIGPAGSAMPPRVSRDDRRGVTPTSSASL